MRTLAQVKKALLSINSHDKEQNHVDADNLLCEVVDILAHDSKEVTIEYKRKRVRLCQQIISAYNEIDKWYA